MFWEDSQDTSAQFVSILDNQDLDKISLEELIDQLPNLVNEYDVGNEKLIAVLKRKDIQESLIRHVTETPAEHLDENDRFKYANSSCVLFSSKSKQMESELIQQTDLLDRLLNFLNTDEDLNPLMASFFANTLFSIYSKFNEEMITYFNSKPDFFDLLFKHIHISAIMDLLLKITTLESIDSKKSKDVYKWLNSETIIKRLIDVFRKSDNQNALENASYLLSFLISKGRKSLVMAGEEREFNQFYNESFLNELVEICFNHKASAIHIIKVLFDFIDSDYHFKLIDEIKTKLNNLPANSVPLKILNTFNSSLTVASYEYLSSIKNLHNVILLNLDKLKNLLLESSPDYSIKTSTGLIKKPLGHLRLEIIGLFYALLLANNPEFNQAFADNKILEILINLFFEYEFNTFLHNYVNSIVVTIFLSSDLNRFKLLANEKKKADFLNLNSIGKWREHGLSFFEAINFIWSDRDCYLQARKIIMETNEDDLKLNEDYLNEPYLVFTGQLKTFELEYTSLINQLFKECNLIERIMKKYRFILKENDIRKPIPTHKSHLIDIADIINKYLSDFEQRYNKLPDQLIEETNFSQLKEEWINFSKTELELNKSKILGIEKIFKNQQNAAEDFLKFIYRPKIKPLDYISRYNAGDYEFNEIMETILDRDLKGKMNTEIPNLSPLVDHSIYYLNKFKSEIELFSRIKSFDEEKSIEDEQNEQKLTEEAAEQFSGNSEQISLKDRYNMFHPLASSSNISNELNIEMDSDIIKEDGDHHFEDDSFGELTKNIKLRDNQEDDNVETEVQNLKEQQQVAMDDEWADFEKERLNS